MLISEKTFAKIRAKSGVDQLSAREKLVLAAGLLFLFGFLLFQFFVFPYMDARKQLLRSIQRAEGELVEMQLLQQEYGELRQQEGGIKAHLAKRPKDFTLFTFLDQQAAGAEVKQQIVYMKPSAVEGEGEFSESLVEIKLKDVDLEHLVQFMKMIESEIFVVSIRRLSVQTSTKEQGLLDAILQIVTFVEAGE